MAEATHAKCPRCGSYQPIIYKKIEEWTPGIKKSTSFKGFIVECRTCKFEITQIGRFLRTPGLAEGN